MPGYANWKDLYALEYLQLYEEGYPVGDSIAPDHSAAYLPVAVREATDLSRLTEADWEDAYKRLWALRERGIRTDYPFDEPNDFESIIADAADVPDLQPLRDEEYAERIKGAWYGRIGGVVLGKPLEIKVDRKFIKTYLESLDAYPLNDWVPYHSPKLDQTLRCRPSTLGNIQYAEADDDIHYTILGLMLIEERGFNFSKLDVANHHLRNIPYHWLFSCTRQSYYHMVNLSNDRPAEEQIDEFPTKLNPWREGINTAIRADFWGYIAPTDPRRAARIAYREVTLNAVKNGIYSSMFVAGALSAALSANPTIDTILAGGLSVIPRRSRLARIAREVRGWYDEDGDWVPVCDRIYEKYGHLPFLNALHNMAFVMLALIHGGLDYSKTITTAVMCGMDTDCTAGTAASIVGAAVGYEGLDQRWIAPFNDQVETAVAGFGRGSISGLVERNVDLWCRVRGDVVP
ncbi:MAG: ADP-ribosylglycohydrolase family protein [Chloroflexota bacterium]|nr:ADP-ribosylglycohydrolase family protein [Chloroflexota bacterium]